jgi:hypothetical protein
MMLPRWGHWPLVRLLFGALVIAVESQADADSAHKCASALGLRTILVVESIYVSTYVQQNTTFAVNDHLTLTIDNAPTTVDEVVTAISTNIFTVEPQT